jgi:CPA2 family monovalent cation:H+ antiporter-2
VVGVVREKQLAPNPDADFVLLPDDLVAIIGSEKNRDAFLLVASSAVSNEPSKILEKDILPG